MPKKITKDGIQVFKLNSGYTATFELYQEVFEEAKSQLNLMRGKQRFTVKDLCSREFYEGLSPGLKRRVGMCFRTMVLEGLFPVKFQRYKRSATKHYVFID